MSGQMGSSGEEIERLESIIARLRGDNGCPWDKKQTRLTLRSCLLEETYEVLQAINEGSPGHIQEELGDLLLQVVFHAQIAKEEGDFNLAGVIHGVNEKMIRRHPHVFNKEELSSPVNGVADVLRNWEEIKRAEKSEAHSCMFGERQSLLDAVSPSFPALLQAEKIQKKATQVGFDWPDLNGPLSKVIEELEEVKEAWQEWQDSQRKQERTDLKTTEKLRLKVEEEFGDLLFSLVNTARYFNLHPEIALIRTIEKFRRRFALMEQSATATGKNLSDLTLEEMDELWEASKAMNG